jgi:hypothetical protein
MSLTDILSNLPQKFRIKYGKIYFDEKKELSNKEFSITWEEKFLESIELDEEENLVIKNFEFIKFNDYLNLDEYSYEFLKKYDLLHGDLFFNENNDCVFIQKLRVLPDFISFPYKKTKRERDEYEEEIKKRERKNLRKRDREIIINVVETRKMEEMKEMDIHEEEEINEEALESNKRKLEYFEEISNKRMKTLEEEMNKLTFV